MEHIQNVVEMKTTREETRKKNEYPQNKHLQKTTQKNIYAYIYIDLVHLISQNNQFFTQFKIELLTTAKQMMGNNLVFA